MTLLTDAEPDRLLEVLERRADGLVHVERIPARPARFADLVPPLPARLQRLWLEAVSTGGCG